MNISKQYAGSFGATVKESVKLAPHWAAYYHTSRRFWQETTMAKHGTLAEFLYQRHLEVGDKVHMNFRQGGDLNKGEEEAASDSNEDQFFDESSDEDVDISIHDTNSQGQQDESGASTNVLFEEGRDMEGQ